MNLCDRGHDEICFDGHKCPLCETVEEKDKEILDLRNEIDCLKIDVASLESTVAELEDRRGS